MLRLLLLGCMGLLGIAQDAHTIAGRVVRHLDQRPIKGVQVSIVKLPEMREVSVVSGENGEFAFRDVPAAKYQLAVTEHGARQLYQQTEQYSTAIVTGVGQDTEHILFALVAPANLAGRVTDEYNEPVPQARVMLFYQSLAAGKQQTRIIHAVVTDASGRFHFRDLEAGTYYVACTGRPWYAQSFEPESAHTELDVAYPVTYYGGATSAEGATPLTLEEGQKAEIEVAMHAVPALHVKLDEQKQKGPSARQTGPGGARFQVDLIQANGELVGLAPGTYTLTLGGPTQTVTLTADTTLEGIASNGTTVKGRVTWGEGKPGEPRVVLFKDSNSHEMHMGVVQPDGTFTAIGFSAGHYVIGTNTSDAYPATIEVKGAPYLDGELSVTDGAHIAITATFGRGLSKVGGVVMNGQKAAGGAMVLFIPQDRAQGRTIGRAQSDGDGTFEIADLIPGRYFMVAIDDGRGLAYADRGVMAPYLRGGPLVDLPTNGPVKVEVQHRLQ